MKKTLSFLLALAMVVSIITTLGITISAESTGNTFDMKVARQRSCNCTDGKVWGACPDCDFSTRDSCTTCEGMGYGYVVDCTECGGDGIKKWEDTISVTLTGELKVGSTLTATNNTPSVSVDFSFYSTKTGFQSSPYTISASDINGEMKIMCDATTNAWDNTENSVVLGIVPTNNICDLDLDDATTDIENSKSLDQNYTLTVYEGGETDTTKVKVSWAITDINVTRQDAKKWNPSDMKWDDDDDNDVISASNGQAVFTIENYSSVMIDVTATFDPEDDFNPTVSFDDETGDDGQITVDTANGNSEYSKTNVPTGEITVTVTPDTEIFKSLDATTKATKYGVYTIEIAEHNEDNCVLAGTEITLANGDKKLVENITLEDELLSYDFFDGTVKGNYPVYITKHENTVANVISLTFSDDTTLQICDCQTFFDTDAKDFYEINSNNFRSAIGKHILKIENGEKKIVSITNAVYNREVCSSYELFVSYTVDFLANNVFTIEPDTIQTGTYTFTDEFVVDADIYREDVEKYGLYEYTDEPFHSLFTLSVTFDKLLIADTKIAVGKGILSEEDLFAIYNVWTPYYTKTAIH